MAVNYLASPPKKGNSEAAALSGKRILSLLFDLFLEKEAGTLAGEDIEFLHRMRVATRRMRSLLKVMNGVYDEERIEPINYDLRRVGQLLGEVRDIDTFVPFLRSCQTTLPKSANPAIEHVIEDRLTAREQKLKIIRAEFKSEWYIDLKRSMAEFIAEHSFYDLESEDIQIVAPRLIENCLIKILKHRNRMYNASPAELHRQRIRFKRFRYTCEFFMSFYGNKLAPFIKELEDIQDILGLMQDHSRDIQFLESRKDEIVSDMKNKNASASLNDLLKHFHKSIEQEHRKFLLTWRIFSLPENELRYLYIIRNGIV